MTEQTQSSCDPTEFAGKRALVTGGTKGVGEAIVRRLSAGGATVATTARSALPEGHSVKLFIQADVSNSEGVAKVVREVLDHFGGHGAAYVNPRVVQRFGLLGRSWGCPAVDRAVLPRILRHIKEGTALFAYYPDPRWLRQSRFLQCDANLAAK